MGSGPSRLHSGRQVDLLVSYRGEARKPIKYGSPELLSNPAVKNEGAEW